MTNKDAIAILTDCLDKAEYKYGAYGIALKMAIKALEQEPCEDCCNGNQIEKAKLCQKSYLAGMEHKQEPKTGQFAKWVATEIFDENWDYNKDAFAEIACRKLAKLGIVRAKGDEWELVESKEMEG